MREDWSCKRALETPCHARIATSPQDTAGHVSWPAKPKVTWGTNFPQMYDFLCPRGSWDRRHDLKRVIVAPSSKYSSYSVTTISSSRSTDRRTVTDMDGGTTHTLVAYHFNAVQDEGSAVCCGPRTASQRSSPHELPPARLALHRQTSAHERRKGTWNVQ